MSETPISTESSNERWFSDDKAIEKAEDDRLGRVKFASELAQSIRSWTDDSSYVIALYGKWGSGKTSVKNMVVEKLDGDDAPLVIEFNPWEWSGQDKLTESFFQEIGNEIELKCQGSKSSDKSKKLSAKFKLLGGVLTTIGTISKFSIPIPILGLLTEAALKTIGESLKLSGDTISAGAELQKKSLREVKKDITKELQNFDKSILVVIDDIDRLTDNEIKMLFQLIKANADFPRMMYLLLCDRDIIEKSLEQISPATDGKLFLEKIVQLDFNIPQATPQKIQDSLFVGLNQLLDNPILSKRYDNDAFVDVYVSGLLSYFSTLRSVKRYLNSLQFQTGLIVKNGSCEVNYSDFMAIEVLRLFEPRVYSSLYSFKEVLTSQNEGYLSMHGSQERANLKLSFDTIVAKSENKNSVEQILYHLFPTTQPTLPNGNYGGNFMNVWFKDLRICHPKMFDRYFILDISESDIQHGELELFIENSNDYDYNFGKLKEWVEKGVIQDAIEKLSRAFIEDIPIEKPVDFLRAFFDIGELLPIEHPGVVGIKTSSLIDRIIYHYLEKFDKNERSSIMQEALSSSVGIFLSLDQIISNKDSHKEDEVSRRPPLFDVHFLEKMSKICLEKLNKAQKNTILNHFKMLQLMYEWIEISDISTVKFWVKTNIQTDEELLTFLNKLISNSTTSGSKSRSRKIHWGIDYGTLETFFDLHEITVRMQTISENPELTKDQQNVIQLFNIAVKRKESGRSDDNFSKDTDLS